MRAEFGLDLTQEQKLIMTPELIQSIRLLQLSLMDLGTYVEEELLENPCLEEEEDHQEALQAYLEEYYFRKKTAQTKGGGLDRREDRDSDWIYERSEQQHSSLEEHLRFQLGTMQMTPRYRALCEYLIDWVEDSGYLSASEEELLAQYEGDCCPEELEDAIRLLQNFDPPGVFARNLKECLRLQLEDLGIYDACYARMFEECLEDMSQHRLKEIAKKIGCDVQKVQERMDTLKSLEPKPGHLFSGREDTVYLVPDLLVREEEGRWVVESNESIVPHLRISPYYEQIMGTADTDKETRQYLKKQVESATWLLRGLEQRKNTLRKVGEAIIRHQEDFLQQGPRALRPLTMERIAEELGVHESTVSRAVKEKYMDTPQGLYELRSFFSGGLEGQNGREVSAAGAKEILKSIIGEEDPRKPLSDQTIVQRMAEHGIGLSRRTVAKYRDELGIPGSSQRRRY